MFTFDVSFWVSLMSFLVFLRNFITSLLTLLGILDTAVLMDRVLEIYKSVRVQKIDFLCLLKRKIRQLTELSSVADPDSAGSTKILAGSATKAKLRSGSGFTKMAKDTLYIKKIYVSLLYGHTKIEYSDP